VKHGSHLSRSLGLRDALCVVIGAIIGVGIFFTPARVASVTGSEGLAILAWCIGGGIAFLGALTFAELGGLYPSAGGQYSALRDAFGTSTAFVYGFSLMTAIQAGAVAIIGIVCAQHLGLAIQGEPPAAGPVILLSGILIVGLTVANALGVRWGAAIQNVTVYVKVATLLVVAGVAAWHGGPVGWRRSSSP
jgi:APA family basic amino acid/polyamine antiporter